MVKHYAIVAFRHLRRQLGYASINVFGLALGLASCILIALFVQHEMSYDRFHANADRLYRAWVFEDYGDAEQFLNTTTPLPLGPTLAETYPEVEAFVRVDKSASTVHRGDDLIPQSIHITDPNFFDVFSFPLLYGERDQVLHDPTQVVLTQAAAQRYFGRTNAVGETMLLQVGGDVMPFTVAGIAADVPAASSIQFEVVVPFRDDFYGERALQSWFNVSPETYVMVREDASMDELRDKVPELSRMILGDNYRPDVYNIGLQAMPAIHLDTTLPAGSEPISDPQYSYILGGIALLILLIACINFMTLSIGRSAKRALEVAVRKVVGAQQGQLRRQFWGEALLMTIVALLLGIALASVALPTFSQLAGRDLVLSADIGSLTFALILTLVVGLIAGSYPALVLAGFRPIDVLKGTLRFGGRRQVVQHGLVVLQLALSVLLIITTLGMQQQLRFLQTKNLGFDKEQAIVILTNLQGPEGRAAADRFRETLASDPRIKNVAASSFNIADGWGKAGYTDESGVYRVFWVNVITPEYLQTLGIDLSAGRDYQREATDDMNRGIIVNEALVREYGWADPIGQRLPGANFGDHTVIGVVADFHYSTLRSEVLPLVLMANSDPIFKGIENYDGASSFSPDITVRVQGDDLLDIVGRLEQAWAQVAPGQTFDYVFLDEAVDSQYRAEERLGTIVTLGTILSLIVACLGLFGLATLVTVRRTKEIGIRKTMGASASDITLMISREFAILVGIAVLIASPVAFLALRAWLQGFAYQTTLSVWLFVGAALLALAVALLAVSYHAIRAARLDPVNALRYE